MKCVLFDFDGVLADGKVFHRDLFLKALKEKGGLSLTADEHQKRLEAMSTRQKLEHLVKGKYITEAEAKAVSNYKQKLTEESLAHIKLFPFVGTLFKELKKKGVDFAIVTNTTPQTMSQLKKIKKELQGVAIISPEEVTDSKPSPAMYYAAMAEFGHSLKDYLIVEDSKNGIRSGQASGAAVLQFRAESDHLSLKDLEAAWAKGSTKKIDYLNEKNLKPFTLVIPCAGLGSRFREQGFKLPKPLIDVKGQPMIERVYDNLGIRAKQVIFIVRKDDEENYGMGSKIKQFCPEAFILEVDGLQQGAYKTVECARKIIPDDHGLIIANSDQLIDYDAFKVDDQLKDSDGLILTFDAFGEKWSYARTENGEVVEVAEKKQISNEATCGVYYFKTASDFFEAGDKMVAAGETTNGEYYICPVFNYFEGRVTTCRVKKMQGIGTPEDLANYLNQTTRK